VALCILNFIYLICLTDKEGTLTPMFVMPAFELPKRGPRQPAGEWSDSKERITVAVAMQGMVMLPPPS
jgi:hypothetical protein